MDIYVIEADTATRLAGPFDTIGAAKEAQVALRKAQGARLGRTKLDHVPTPEMIAAAQAREATRLRDGTYKVLPDWFPTKPDHYAHLSKAEGYIAFTLNKAQLVEDRHERMPASTYLARYFCERLAPHEISALHHRLHGWRQGYSDLEVTGDSGVIYDAYVNSAITSCMASNFPDLRGHPTEAYGDGSDVHIAIIRNRNNEIVARAMVNIKNKRYVSVYGANETAREHLRAALAAEDYHYDYYGMRGARLNLVKDACDSDKYLMPYIDGGCGYIDRDGELRESAGWRYVQQTCGYVCC